VRDLDPPYLRVAADFRRKIENGELLPGEQLPSLDNISAQYAISRATAQKAIRVLIDAGIVVSRPRWGVFVSERTAG
jgi:DNA-binding GntR family transcriptional regulator